jgi:hypothetical protein
MDAITMLRDDHRTVEKLFKAFEDAGHERSSRSALSGVAQGGVAAVQDLIDRVRGQTRALATS